MCGCLSHTLYWGPGLKPRHVPSLGIEPVTLWLTGWHSTHCTTSARALMYILFTSFSDIPLKNMPSTLLPHLDLFLNWDYFFSPKPPLPVTKIIISSWHTNAEGGHWRKAAQESRMCYLAVKKCHHKYHFIWSFLQLGKTGERRKGITLFQVGLSRRRTWNEGLDDFLRRGSQGRQRRAGQGWMGGSWERWDLQRSLQLSLIPQKALQCEFIPTQMQDIGCLFLHTNGSLTKCLSTDHKLSVTTSHTGNHFSMTWVSSILS